MGPHMIVDRNLRNTGVTVHDPGCRPAAIPAVTSATTGQPAEAARIIECRNPRYQGCKDTQSRVLRKNVHAVRDLLDMAAR
jgi:hypothetical protein